MTDKKKVTNAEFTKEDKVFLGSCQKVGIEPSRRQASKYRNKKGQAYNGLPK